MVTRAEHLLSVHEQNLKNGRGEVSLPNWTTVEEVVVL